MGVDEVLNFVLEKLKQALLAVSTDTLTWFDNIFPPETRSDKINHWFHVAFPYLIAAAVFAFVVCFCRCCCCRGGGGRVRMMKAPGRNYRMPRSSFEANPKDYFRNLRAQPGDQLC